MSKVEKCFIFVLMSEIREKLSQHFPHFNEEGLLKEIETHGRIMKVEAGTSIMNIGSYIKIMPLVTKGAIKVMREDDEGGELFLYFLYPGQSCAMTVQCCMANAPSEVKTLAEDETELIALPIEVIDRWMEQYTSWKNFILTTYMERFNELLHTIDSVVFQQLDDRLMEYLREKARIAGSPTIQSTHQNIAYDLHSSREVISRLLKQFEKHGKIRLGRNKIELL